MSAHNVRQAVAGMKVGNSIHQVVPRDKVQKPSASGDAPNSQSDSKSEEKSSPKTEEKAPRLSEYLIRKYPLSESERFFKVSGPPEVGTLTKPSTVMNITTPFPIEAINCLEPVQRDGNEGTPGESEALRTLRNRIGLHQASPTKRELVLYWATRAEINKIVRYTRQHYPIYSIFGFDSADSESLFVHKGMITGNHEVERKMWLSSFKSRSVECPDVVNEYVEQRDAECERNTAWYRKCDECGRTGNSSDKDTGECFTCNYSKSDHYHVIADEAVFFSALRKDTGNGENKETGENSERTPEEILASHMRYRARWNVMPDPALLLNAKDDESDAIIKLVSIEPRLLRNKEVLLALVTTPSYFKAFAYFLKKGMINDRDFKTSPWYDWKVIEHLQAIERVYVAKKLKVVDDSPFVFRLDNPICAFVDITPQKQDEILSFVTFGISDMIDYSRGALLSGSMISAAIQFIKDGDLFLLESNYPRVYTSFADEFSKGVKSDAKSEGSKKEIYDEFRACMCAHLSGNATMTISYQSEKSVRVKFQYFHDSVSPSSYTRFRDHTRGIVTRVNNAEYRYRPIARFPDETVKKSSSNIEGCASVSFDLTPSAGCDIDVPVDSSNPDDIKHVACDLLTKMNEKWPGAYMKVITKHRKNPMYRITTDNIENRFQGFRDVEIFPAADPRSQVASYHVNAVRAWKGYYPGIYLTASCLQGHVYMKTTNHHYFAGKDEPWRVIDKYATRGFRYDDMNSYEQLRMEVEKDNPQYDHEYINSISSIGICGSFSIFAHFPSIANWISSPYEKRVDVKGTTSSGVSIEEAMKYGSIEEWETYEQRYSRIMHNSRLEFASRSVPECPPTSSLFSPLCSRSRSPPISRPLSPCVLSTSPKANAQ